MKIKVLYKIIRMFLMRSAKIIGSKHEQYFNTSINLLPLKSYYIYPIQFLKFIETSFANEHLYKNNLNKNKHFNNT